MDDESLLRYSRHLLLEELDIDGQQKLIDAHVLIIGLGGLGCPAALYLAASGVGQLTLVDHDTVELSNLQRQIAHTEQCIGLAKVESAKAQIHAINRHVKVNSVHTRLSDSALAKAVESADLVLDCTDNFDARFAINQACVATQTPLVSGAAIRWEAQVAVFAPALGGACYECLYKPGANIQASCAESGVIAPLVGIIGNLQALEAIKLLTGVGQPLVNRLLLLDAKTLQWREITLTRDPSCSTCSIHR
ncbi:molybdopterin-synthase adenylyltransferase MoeB [Simiduia sp. 21SJ11W-1]|uniref:HesA/MoeB/ThiF family protein n=1 Tax=Simiduia sp. 21SJ11W-1 TaxID=2909669 RepID=UPI00209E830F|nr:molybdopterin-synthase adenylyltransferase MoeB [Simiduia sp. 21SJ11W-1]UTA47477.1 molybdopterin-synthase adenylyltransferase MoeB [Simiduia sp. 21SJ11W-1]